MNRKWLLLLLVTVLTASAQAIYIGTAPGVKDIGVVERGETREVRFFIVTSVSDDFEVRPSFTRASPTMYFDREEGQYTFIPSEGSQEDISDWVEFRKDSYEVDPDTENVISLADGGFATTQGDVVFDLHVPEDAEPGYHTGAINLNPALNQGGPGGTGVNTMGVTQLVFVFRVPGVAERDLQIVDVTGLRTAENSARIDFLVKNNGTVTTRVRRSNTKIFDRYGNVTGSINTGGMFLEPGKTEVVKTYWKSDNVEGGSYRVRGELSFITGESFIDESVNISDYVQVESTQEEGEVSQPWWLIAILLAILGTMLFYFDVDPFLIFTAVGTLGITAYILMSGLPTYLAGVLIIIVSLIAYRWFI